MKRSKKLGWIGFFLCASLLGAPYIDNGNGTITDSSTGLTWQKCSRGQGSTLGNCNTGNATTSSWTSAIVDCEALTLGGRSDWRLPNINELRSIVYYAKRSTIDSTTFPNTQPGGYWSSSTYAQGTNNAWIVNFLSGDVGGTSKSNSIYYCYVRCVTGP